MKKYKIDITLNFGDRNNIIQNDDKYSKALTLLTAEFENIINTYIEIFNAPPTIDMALLPEIMDVYNDLGIDPSYATIDLISYGLGYIEIIILVEW